MADRTPPIGTQYRVTVQYRNGSKAKQDYMYEPVFMQDFQSWLKDPSIETITVKKVGNRIVTLEEKRRANAVIARLLEEGETTNAR